MNVYLGPAADEGGGVGIFGVGVCSHLLLGDGESTHSDLWHRGRRRRRPDVGSADADGGRGVVDVHCDLRVVRRVLIH